MSKILKEKYPDLKINGNPVPPRTGSFEVTAGEKVLFSKFKVDRFPSEVEINSWNL